MMMAFEITYEKITIHFDDPNTASFYYVEGDGFRVEHFNEPVDLLMEAAKCFIDIIRDDKEPICDIAEGLRSFNYVDAIMRSAVTDGQKTMV